MPVDFIVTHVNETHTANGSGHVEIAGTYTSGSSYIVPGDLVSYDYEKSIVDKLMESQQNKGFEPEIQKGMLGSDKMTKRADEAYSHYKKIIREIVDEAVEILAKEEATEIRETVSWYEDNEIMVETTGTLVGDRVTELIEMRKSALDALDIWHANAILVSDNNDIEPFGIITFMDKVNKLVE